MIVSSLLFAANFSAVGVHALHARWRTQLSDVADAAPIFVSHVRAGTRSRAMLFITSKDGTTYGIDAFAGTILWRFRTHGPKITTSVPATDGSARWIYAAGLDGYIHKLNAATGTEGRGRGFPARVTMMPETEKSASALTVANGYLYAATSGYFGDAPPYVGHVVSVRLSDGATHVFNTLCSSLRTLPSPASCSKSGSGIWSRAGVVVDPDSSMNGRIYVATGNGPFTALEGGQDYGDTVLSLSADAQRLFGYYAPSSYAELESGDVDLGSTAPALLPREPDSKTPLMLVQGGKDGVLRLLDRANLRGVGAELQRVDLGEGVYSTIATRRDAAGATWLYIGLADGVRAYRLKTANRVSRIIRAWTASAGETEEGTSPIVNGSFVFVAMNGSLSALNAATGEQVWRGTIGNVHWQSPIAVNGWVFCADQDGRLNAFGP